MRTEEGSDPHGPWTAIVGVIGAILVVVFVIGIQTLFLKANDDASIQKGSELAAEELTGLVSEQQSNLQGYRWVSKDDGKVAIPIERAIELVITEQGRGPTGSRNDSSGTQ